MKGFFSSIVVFSVLVILLLFNAHITQSQNDLYSIKTDLIDFEQANFKRSIMENNIDKIISTTLRNETFFTNDIIKVKKSINEKLFNYLNERAVAENIFLNTKNKLTPGFLNKNSTVTIYEINGLFYAEYTFTSGISKQETISKNLSKNNQLTFKVPINYSKKIIGGKI